MFLTHIYTLSPKFSYTYCGPSESESVAATSVVLKVALGRIERIVIGMGNLDWDGKATAMTASLHRAT